MNVLISRELDPDIREAMLFTPEERDLDRLTLPDALSFQLIRLLRAASNPVAAQTVIAPKAAKLPAAPTAKGRPGR